MRKNRKILIDSQAGWGSGPPGVKGVIPACSKVIGARWS